MKEMKSDIRRFLHWGPATVLSLTFYVLHLTLTMNSMWWPAKTCIPSMINYGLIWFNTLGIIYNFMRSFLAGPGYLPRKWRPENPRDVDFLQFCQKCEGYKAPRSHHCRRCDRCVLKMDHHCPWINNCVGWNNQANFFLFLVFFLSGAIHSSWILGYAFIRGITRKWLITNGFEELATVTLSIYSALACIAAFSIAVGVALACLKLLHMQGKVLLGNRTDIETWILQKAKLRRDKDANIEPFVYPYNLGWKKNINEVFFPENDGINFPVRSDCNKFTLTIEQLAQKKEKRANAKLFKCIRPFTGRWVPIFSQGLIVSLQMPCTDDPRIALELGDRIIVTRFKSSWLYGEREITKEEKEGSIREGAIRGWFPRCCASHIPYNFEDSGKRETTGSVKSGEDGAIISNNEEEFESELDDTNEKDTPPYTTGNDSEAGGEPAKKIFRKMNTPSEDEDQEESQWTW